MRMGENIPEPMKDLDVELQSPETEDDQTAGVALGSRPPTNIQKLWQRDNDLQYQKGPRTPLDQCHSKFHSPLPEMPPPTRENLSIKSSSRMGTANSVEPKLSTITSDVCDSPNQGVASPRKYCSRASTRGIRICSREVLQTPKGSEDGREFKTERNEGSGTACSLGSKSSSYIPTNIRHKFGSNTVDQLVSEEQARRAIYEVIEGQKRVNNRSNKSQHSMESSMYADYYELGYNMRSNIFQGVLTGPPMEVKSLMKDSYTSDVVERTVRDLQHWHGRKTDDLGRWHQKNALDMNLQKALEQRIGERNRNK